MKELNMNQERRSEKIPSFLGLILTVVLIVVNMVPVATKAYVPRTIPSPTLDPNNVGWASVRNMPSPQFSNYFQEKIDQGYMVVDIEVDEINGEQRVGAVFQRNLDGRGWAEWRNLTGVEFQDKWIELRESGYRLIDQESYVLDGQRNYAGVWIENIEGLNWASRRNLTNAQFSDYFQIYKSAGYMIVDVEAYPVGDEMRYAMAWVENSEDLDWIEWRNLTSAEFSEKFQAYKSDYRMIDVEGYLIDGQQYYAGIWVENENGRDWVEWRDLTAKQFGDKWLRLRDAGYRLIDYEPYATNNGWRYAGIWRQNSIRPSWELKDEVNTLLKDHAAEYDIPGMSVAIMHQGRFVYLRGFGYADIDDKKIATSRTIYRQASVSKAVGGVLSVQLDSQGILNINSPSSAYIPGLPAHHTHTVMQTVSNRSGVGHYDDHAVVSGHYETALAAVQQIWETSLINPPGSTAYYSTHAYTYLGASLEGATGQTISDIIQSQLQVPYNLNSLRPEDRSIRNQNRATLYNLNNNEVTADDLSWKVLGGGLESSVYDLARFGNRLINGTLLNDAEQDLLWTPPDGLSNYALGWSTGTEAGTQVVAKNGAQRGAKSYIRMYPDEEIVIVVMTNRRGEHNPRQLGLDIGALMLAELDALHSELLVYGPATQMQANETEIEEPDEEGLDPADVIWPFENPVAEPSIDDLIEPTEPPINDEFKIFLPLVLRD